jgi:hypothetical protein
MDVRYGVALIKGKLTELEEPEDDEQDRCGRFRGAGEDRNAVAAGLVLDFVRGAIDAVVDGGLVRRVPELKEEEDAGGDGETPGEPEHEGVDRDKRT